MQMQNFDALRQAARERGPQRVALVAAADERGLEALAHATALGIAAPILVGEAGQIRTQIARLGLDDQLGAATIVPAADLPEAAAVAVRLARAGEAGILLKGQLRTDQLLRAVLDKATGLRTGDLLSDVLLYEDRLQGRPRLVAVTDGGINVLPSLEEKAAIIRNAVLVQRRLGVERPKVAVLSATEKATAALPSSVEAERLAEMAANGAFPDCEVFGPLALDNALSVEAARHKGIASPVAGAADILVVPNIEAGNILGKATKYLGGSACAHVVIGARVPVLIPSRTESSDDKLNSIALGALIHG